jgi:hypothetical protein
MINVTKAYGGTLAVDDLSFSGSSPRRVVGSTTSSATNAQARDQWSRASVQA